MIGLAGWAWLVAQVDGFPIDTRVLATATGLLAFFGYLMFRAMGRADRRVDDASATVVGAASAERDRALDGERKAEQRWQELQVTMMEMQRDYLASLDVKNRENAELRAENSLLRQQLGLPPRNMN